eukprot:JP436777.1.p1 GENE.JP436777.1~~JP436777.1.p1  ORF type:complete len:202 (+),score=10.37 JP436777.1:83-688(+)
MKVRSKKEVSWRSAVRIDSLEVPVCNDHDAQLVWMQEKVSAKRLLAANPDELVCGECFRPLGKPRLWREPLPEQVVVVVPRPVIIVSFGDPSPSTSPEVIATKQLTEEGEMPRLNLGKKPLCDFSSIPECLDESEMACCSGSGVDNLNGIVAYHENSHDTQSAVAVGGCPMLQHPTTNKIGTVLSYGDQPSKYQRISSLVD